MQIFAGVLRIGKIDVRNNIYDASVGLLGQTLVLAAVACLHVEDGNMQTLGCDGREAGVGIPENEQRVGLNGSHQLVGAVDDVADGGTEIVPHGVHIDFGLPELKIAEKDAVEVVIVILPRMREDGIEVLAALVDDGGEADDLRPRADDDEQLQLAVVLKVNVGVVKFDLHKSYLYDLVVDICFPTKTTF